jgi:hypothetical protein
MAVNRLVFVNDGDNSILTTESEGTAARLFAALSNNTLMSQYLPMLLTCGVADVGVTVHSHFLTFLATVGQSLDFAAVSDCPILWAPESAKPSDVRADSVWFDPLSYEAVVAAEFERFERGDETKLQWKIQNLAIASTALHSLRLAVLIYWVRSGSTPRSMDSIVSSYREGFSRNGYDVRPATCPLMIVKCVMRDSPVAGKLVFGEFLRDLRNEDLALRRY